MNSLLLPHQLSTFDPITGNIDGGTLTERRLSDLRGIFTDEAAYESALATDDPVIYTVSSVEAGNGDGDLHFGIGRIMPGCIGAEYHMTKGHLHSWRDAAEVYIGLSGEGVMVLEEEDTGDTTILPLKPNGIVYVPGYVAHRTINTGSEPFTYIGIYSAKAGHDYGAIAERNFNEVVIQVDGRPEAMKRADYLTMIAGEQEEA
jgi:glucose-6-phosphate isomerase